MTDAEHSHALAPPSSEIEGACPPPLEWRDVLAEFHRQAEPWYLDRPGRRLTGRVLGQGVPLYFLNGFSGTHELYALLVWLLKDQFRCVLFDYPVGGNREAAPDAIADDLFEIADVCGDQTFHVFASSFAAMAAFSALERRPDRVLRAVLTSGFAHRRFSAAERLLIRAGRYLPIGLRRLPGRTAIQVQNHRRWFPPFDLTRLQFYLDNTGASRISDVAVRGALAQQYDLRPRLPAIRQPVLIVRSEGEGVMLGECADEMTKLLPNAQSEFLNDVGQISFLTHPHRLGKLVRFFLAGEE